MRMRIGSGDIGSWRLEMAVDRRTWWRKAGYGWAHTVDDRGAIIGHENEIRIFYSDKYKTDQQDCILEQIWAIREGLTDR